MEYIWGFFPFALGGLLIAIILYLVTRPNKNAILREAARGGDIYAGFGNPNDPNTKDRPIAARRELAAGYGIDRASRPQPKLTFTPRQLERVNIRRRLRGETPLNKRGFQAAAATAATDQRRPETTDQWLNYFIFYQLFLNDHGSNRTSVDHHFTIDPNLPFNGQGGSFGGAGASGAWDATQSPDAGSGIGLGAAAVATGAVAYGLGGSADAGQPGAVDPIAAGDLPSGSAMSKFLNDPGFDPAQPFDPGQTAAPPNYSAPARDPDPSSSDTAAEAEADSGGGGGGGGGDSGGGGGDSGGGGGGGGGGD